jgi:2-iminobutanoate/2-iminopropanoate deaminase
VTGQLAFVSTAGGVPDGLDAAGQAETVMERIVTLLATEGLTCADLVSVAIYLTDPADIHPVNDVYSRYVREPFPARVTLGVAFLAVPGAKVEIEALARRRAEAPPAVGE